jgi:DNA modification methylase
MPYLPLDSLLRDDCLRLLPEFPARSVDVIIADPPYNLQLKQDLQRPDASHVDTVEDAWDKFDSFRDYDDFTQAWLYEIRRLMTPRATLWVSGTYHNIFRVGHIMQDMGFWILNTIAWSRPNAMPNFYGTRLKNDVEFIIWARHDKDSRYLFNYHLMKRFNDHNPGSQLGSVWEIPICTGNERLQDEQGGTLHPAQKPEALIERLILASSRPGHTVLDPFMGTGTAPAMAKRLRRRWIGIEQNPAYHQAAVERVQQITPLPPDTPLIHDVYKENRPRVAFQKLLKKGYLEAGQTLYLDDPPAEATITPEGKLQAGEISGSIHQMACYFKEIESTNGWKCWQYRDETGELQSINELREAYRINELDCEEP